MTSDATVEVRLARGSYNQFCPVAMAAEILCTRWTMLVVRELMAGSTRFNDLRRGVPRMSPALLSQRLKELEAGGIVARVALAADPAIQEYQLTPAGRELAPIVQAFGVWGQRWVDGELTLQRLDYDLLMWDMRRSLDPSPMPKRRCVIQFLFNDTQRTSWIIVDPPDLVDLCAVDPGFDVDLYVSTDLRTLTAIWMGMDTVRAAVSTERMALTGNKQLASDMQKWLGLSGFAKERKQVA